MAESIMDAGLQALRRRSKARDHAYVRVFDLADRLKSITVDRFQELATTLDRQVHPLSPPDRRYQAGGRGSRLGDAHWYYAQIVQTARRLDYFANFQPYRAWATLAINTIDAFYLVVSLHGVGPVFHGVLAASACTFRRVDSEDGREPIGHALATNELFQFNYAESPAAAEARFHTWLEDVLVIALESWRRSVATD